MGILIGRIENTPMTLRADTQERINNAHTGYIVPFWKQFSLTLRSVYTGVSLVDWNTVGVELAPSLSEVGYAGGANLKILPTNLRERFKWVTSDGKETWLQVEYVYGTGAYSTPSPSYPLFILGWLLFRFADSEERLNSSYSRLSMSPVYQNYYRDINIREYYSSLDYVFSSDVFMIRAYSGDAGLNRKTYPVYENHLMLFRIGQAEDKYWAGKVRSMPANNNILGAYSDRYLTALPYDWVSEDVPGIRHSTYTPNAMNVANSSKWKVQEKDGIWRDASLGFSYPIVDKAIRTNQDATETILPGLIVSTSSRIYSNSYPGACFLGLPGALGEEGSEITIQGNIYKNIEMFGYDFNSTSTDQSVVDKIGLWVKNGEVETVVSGE